MQRDPNFLSWGLLWRKLWLWLSRNRHNTGNSARSCFLKGLVKVLLSSVCVCCQPCSSGQERGFIHIGVIWLGTWSIIDFIVKLNRRIHFVDKYSTGFFLLNRLKMHVAVSVLRLKHLSLKIYFKLMLSTWVHHTLLIQKFFVVYLDSISRPFFFAAKFIQGSFC